MTENYGNRFRYFSAPLVVPAMEQRGERFTAQTLAVPEWEEKRI